jgi:hypothetical protein
MFSADGVDPWTIDVEISSVLVTISNPDSVYSSEKKVNSDI